MDYKSKIICTGQYDGFLGSQIFEGHSESWYFRWIAN